MLNRRLENTASLQTSHPAHKERSYPLNQVPFQQHAPVLRRERQRHSDRPRAHSASGLAASVGLPCPFTSPGTATTLDWHNGERLCQPNLDSIAFPETGPTNQKSPSGTSGVARQNSNNSSTSDETLKDFPSSVAPATSKSTTTPSPPHPDKVWGSADTSLSVQLSRPFDSRPATLPRNPVSHTKPLPSLRISESNLHDVQSPALLQDDDEVFLDPPPPSPSPPQLPIKETEIMTDFPLPPPATFLAEEDLGLTEALQSPRPLRPIR